MGAEVLVPLLIQALPYGISFAQFLITTIEQKGALTPDDWAKLRLLANVSAADEMTSRLKAAGVDPASDQGKALLALVS